MTWELDQADAAVERFLLGDPTAEVNGRPVMDVQDNGTVWLGRHEQPTDEDRAEAQAWYAQMQAEVAAMPPPTEEERAAAEAQWQQRRENWEARDKGPELSTREAQEMLARFGDDQNDSTRMLEDSIARDLGQQAAADAPDAVGDADDNVDREWRELVAGLDQDDAPAEDAETVAEPCWDDIEARGRAAQQSVDDAEWAVTMAQISTMAREMREAEDSGYRSSSYDDDTRTDDDGDVDA